MTDIKCDSCGREANWPDDTWPFSHDGWKSYACLDIDWRDRHDHQSDSLDLCHPCALRVAAAIRAGQFREDNDETP